MNDRARPLHPRLVPPVLVGTGALLVGLTLLEIANVLLGAVPFTVVFGAGIVTSLPFTVFLVVGGRWLGQSDLSERHYGRIAGWSLAGLLFLGGFFALVASFAVQGTWPRIAALRWGMAVGAGGGALVGIFNARAIDRAIEAERVRAAELERRQELLDYLNDLLRHEVLNTATVIDGYAELLSDPSADDADRREYGSVVRSEVDNLTRVTRDVRRLLEAEETGGGKPVDLGEVLREELDTFRERHREVETTAEIPDGVYVGADGRCGRLFANLFANAVDGEAGRLTVRVDTGDERVVVRVGVDGTGLPVSDSEDPFDPAIGPRTGTDHALGLVVVDRLADRYGGAVELADDGPDGSEFVVELPRSGPPGGQVADSLPAEPVRCGRVERPGPSGP